MSPPRTQTKAAIGCSNLFIVQCIFLHILFPVVRERLLCYFTVFIDIKNSFIDINKDGAGIHLYWYQEFIYGSTCRVRFIDIKNSFIDINKWILDIKNSFIDINKDGCRKTHLLISINEFLISRIHLLISINEFLISINEFLISINEFLISINQTL